MVLILGVKEPQLLQVLKLVHLMFRLAVDIHLNLTPALRAHPGLLRGPLKKLRVLRRQTVFGLPVQHVRQHLFPVELLRPRRLIVSL